MYRVKNTNSVKMRSGFTLIELLVVLVILGLLAGLVGPKLINYLGRAKSDTAKLQIEQMAAAFDLFLIDVGRYPTEDEGLEALVSETSTARNWNGPYLKDPEVPLDPWGNPYNYRYPGDVRDFDLYSLGADNSEGGKGENKDVTN